MHAWPVSARNAEHTVLHAVIREHLDAFVRDVGERGQGSRLSELVEQEFRESLTAGIPSHGVSRLGCKGSL